MLDIIQQIMDEDRFFRIAVYVLMIGIFATFYMLFTTLIHYYFGTELPDQSEFFMDQADN